MPDTLEPRAPLLRLARAASTLALLVILVAPAHAVSSINLRWDECIADPSYSGGPANRSFACNTNIGTHLLAGSFVSPADIPHANGSQIVIDLAAAGAVLPAWWEFKNPGSCRSASLGISTAISPNEVNCLDWAEGTAFSSIDSYLTAGRPPGEARIIASTTIPPNPNCPDCLPGPAAGLQYFAFMLTFNSQKTVGTGACGGCDVSVCIALGSIRVTSTVQNEQQFLYIGRQAGDQMDDARVLWQPGSGQTPCPGPVPTKNRTWGKVKSLYR